MEHTSEPVNRVLDDLRQKFAEREKKKRKKLALRFGNKRSVKRHRLIPGQFTLL